MSSNYSNIKNTGIASFISKNQLLLPIIITIVFFIVISYISFYHHLTFTERDGIFYYFVGEEILKGNTEDIAIPGASIGGPILHALLGDMLDDPFLAGKIISIFGGTGIVFLSYYIARNFFENKIALLTQLLFAVNAKIAFLSIMVLNEITPLFFIFVSLYFATKKKRTVSTLILVGVFLGISFWFRYQSVIVLISFLIFLLIFERDKILKLKNIVITSTPFILMISPILAFNYFNFGSSSTLNTSYYLFYHSKFQTQDWHDKMEAIFDQGIISAINLDPFLFFKNYFYNLFFHSPDQLFKFSFDSFESLSIIPIFPFLGMIPVFGGFLYLTKTKISKNQIITMILSIFVAILLIQFFGDIEYHFMLLIIIPFVVIGISNIKKIPDNVIFLILLSVIFMSVISIFPVYRSYQLFPIWLIIPILSSVFLIKGIPEIQIKFKELLFKRNLKK